MKTLTQLQRKAFFMGIRPAAQEVGEDPEVYRRRILKEELDVEHLADVKRTGDFDKLMSRIWADRGDYDQAAKYAISNLKRLRYLVVSAARRIVAAKDDWIGTAYDYIAGVMIQCGMAQGRPNVVASELLSESGWLRFNELQLKRLLMMLNTHLGRKRKAV